MENQKSHNFFVQIFIMWQKHCQCESEMCTFIASQTLVWSRDETHICIIISCISNRGVIKCIFHMPLQQQFVGALTYCKTPIRPCCNRSYASINNRWVTKLPFQLASTAKKSLALLAAASCWCWTAQVPVAISTAAPGSTVKLNQGPSFSL